MANDLSLGFCFLLFFSFPSRGGVCHELSECHVVANPAEKDRMRAEGHTVKDGQNRVNGRGLFFLSLCV